ncbi:MAG TPA: iron ABC transporter permease [Caulobacteraceae bacterium]|nr:iron ABC transporter permease [Caulobacteraceae bacterium]
MKLNLLLLGLLAAALALSLAFGEVALTLEQYRQAVTEPGSIGAQIIFGVRAPRAATAALVGAALGLSGAVMQGLLRNPLADPGVLGVSAAGGLGASAAIALGFAARPGGLEAAALAGALGAGALVAYLAGRLREPETLILFGVALAALGGALTALILNLSPSPVAADDVLKWLLGSAADRDWSDLALALAPMALGAALCAYAAGGLRMLTLGEETAALSGLPMARLRAASVAGSALLTGASVALAGVIGFVGLAAPHIVRGSVSDDPARTLAPSAITGAILLTLADLAARMIPTAEELKLGVVTALFGAPLFAVVAWRAARSWRA